MDRSRWVSSGEESSTESLPPRCPAKISSWVISDKLAVAFGASVTDDTISLLLGSGSTGGRLPPRSCFLVLGTADRQRLPEFRRRDRTGNGRGNSGCDAARIAGRSRTGVSGRNGRGGPRGDGTSGGGGHRFSGPGGGKDTESATFCQPIRRLAKPASGEPSNRHIP